MDEKCSVIYVHGALRSCAQLRLYLHRSHEVAFDDRY